MTVSLVINHRDGYYERGNNKKKIYSFFCQPTALVG